MSRRFMTVPDIYLAALLAMRHRNMVGAYKMHKARINRDPNVNTIGIDRSSHDANIIGSMLQRSKTAKRAIRQSKNVPVSIAYDAQFLLHNQNLLLEALEILLKHELRDKCCRVMLGYACENVSRLTGIPLNLRK